MDPDVRRFEKIEERINLAEREITAVAEKQSLIKENLKEDLERARTDLRERIEDLKLSLKDNINDVSGEIAGLSKSVDAINKQLQNLYIIQKGDTTKITIHEKIVWGIVFIFSSGALYLLQNFIASLLGSPTGAP